MPIWLEELKIFLKVTLLITLVQSPFHRQHRHRAGLPHSRFGLKYTEMSRKKTNFLICTNIFFS